MSLVYARMIMAVLGQRGEWLAAQNPDWLYATQRDEKDVWETGDREERLLLLEHLRTVDPNNARELLATTWSQESAKDRVAFLEKFAIGLNASDEPFLNEALHDRSVEVRRVARSLLGRLPSDFSRRLKELANQVLSFKKPLIGKARIEVALPEDPIAWLKANDIEIDSPPRNAAQSVGRKVGVERDDFTDSNCSLESNTGRNLQSRSSAQPTRVIGENRLLKGLLPLLRETAILIGLKR